MVFFGFNKKVADQRWAAYPNTLCVGNMDDVLWIKRSQDPLVWHDAVLACLIFRGDPHGLVSWVAEQDRLDHATAVIIFLHGSNGYHRVMDEPIRYENMRPDQVIRAIDIICERDRNAAWARNNIAQPGDGWEPERLKTLEALNSHPKAPVNLLSIPLLNKGIKMPYVDIGEGELISQAYARETMPFLYD